MSRSLAYCVGAAALILPSCTIDVPFDPATLLLPGNTLGEALEKFGQQIEDPFNNRPTPLLLGGDAKRIFYATDLTEIDIRFDGPTNDIVLPGFIGPSNVYVHEDGERKFVRRLVPTGALWRLATDGTNVAFVQKPGLGTDAQQNDLVLNGQVLLSHAPGDEAFFADVVLVEGTLAVTEQSLDGAFASRVHVFDAASGQARFLVSAAVVSPLSLLGDELVYWTNVGGAYRLVELNVVSGENHTLAERTSPPRDVFQSANRVVWSEEIDFGHVRVLALDHASGQIATLGDTVSGRLAGATDGVFVSEEQFTADNDVTGRIAVRRHNADGTVEELANFRADRRAGQTFVAGDRAVFVNDDQRIVVVPLAGGDRFNFSPF
jgi:hypothetical protein